MLETSNLYLLAVATIDVVRSELIVLILSAVAAILYLWLWLSMKNQHSSISQPQPAVVQKNHARNSETQNPQAIRGVVGRSLTLRISNIPRQVTEGKFRDILTRLQPTLLGFSYTPMAASSFAERYAVATATFAEAPALSELERAIKREIGVDASRLKVDLDFFGLTPLTDPLSNTTVDIIAVTGLAGHAFGSWKSKNKPDMWLRDFLPESVPNARILTYGYDTKLPGSQSEASILELSKRLLESIKTIRHGQTKNRPLILIGHSLGGLIVKEALVEASEGSEVDQAVFKSCYAVIFFAVPNRGLDNSSLMSMVKGQPNEDLIKSLSGSSRFLSLLHQRFDKCFTLEDSKIICVFETRTTPTVKWCLETASWEKTGPKVMMVPHTSAIHAGPNEKAYDQLSIDADHSEIVKFSDTSNPDYLIIESRIRELIAKAPGVIRERFANLRRRLSRLEIQYLEALKAPDYAAFKNHKVNNPTSGTLGWFLENEQVNSWQMADESSVLWVNGSPGQGKTIIAKFLLMHLEDLSLSSNRHITVIYFFFYDQDDNYRTVGAALRSLIKQLLSVQDAFQIISDNFNIEISTITDESTWAILKELLHSPIFGKIYCVIDALDECQDIESRERLIEFIKTLVQPSVARRRERFPIFKAFLTSRPTVDLGRNLKDVPSVHLKASHDDLKTFIQGNIQVLGLATEIERTAIDLLSRRVEQTFLWISIILKKVKVASTLLSQADMERIISESPSELTDLYEGIISQIMQSGDIATQKLLTWTVFGRRALTLKELEVALAVRENVKSEESIGKYKIHLTEEAITSAAGVILEIDGDEKVYLIHQSAKDFLLKSRYLTDTEFCRGLYPSIYLAKTCMIYLCFTDFIEKGPCRDSALLEKRNCQHPFFRYAARNWHRHIRTDDDINDFANLISQLTQPGSPGLLAWGEAAGIPNLDKARDIWDIATKANIAWLADFQLPTGNNITEEVVKKAASRGVAGYNNLKTLIKKHGIHFTEGTVCAAAKFFDQGVVRLMLERDPSISITPALMGAAAANLENGRSVMDLLLESQGSCMVTAEVIQLAAENSKSGRDVIELILHYTDANIPEAAIAQIAARFDTETMRLLLNSREGIKVTDMLINAAMSNYDNREEMILLLLQQQNRGIQIAEKVTKAIAETFNENIISFLLENWGQDIQISEEVVQIIAKKFDKNIMMLLLSQRGDEITITEDVMKAASGNGLFGAEIIGLILDRRGGEITITEDIIKAVAGNEQNGKELIQLLFNRRGDKITITEDAIKAAAGNRIQGKEIMDLLFNWLGDDIIITEDVIKAAAGNEFCGDEIMPLLFERRGRDITITENIIKAAAGNEGVFITEILKLLLDWSGGEVTITEDIIKAAARNEENGKEVIKLLFDRQGDKIVITEDIIKTAAGNQGNYTKQILELLLDQRGQEVTITEDIVKAAARNEQNGKQVIQLLFDQRGDKIIITEAVIKAAVQNEQNGWGVVNLLFYRGGGGHKITITEDIIKAAARNERSGEMIMDFFFIQRGDEITITEDIIKAAAGNNGNGKEIIELVFNLREEKITITEGAIKAMEIWKQNRISSTIPQRCTV